LRRDTLVESNRKITILSGHFGSGKTEIAINLALAERQADLIHVNRKKKCLLIIAGMNL
jgi:Mrp family chromosome partitioning ATPase